MKTVTAKQIQKLDRIAIQNYKIESLFLMENAGKAVAEETESFCRNSNIKKIAIFCGKGNNGGDGFVTARYLSNKGFAVKIFFAGKVKEITSDAFANLDLLLNLNQEIIKIPDQETFKKQKHNLKDCSLVIDALFGVGLKGIIREPFKTIIEFLNRSKKKIVSIDVPSGLDATKGLPQGVCVRADKTITFSLAKKGFFINQGPKFAGKIKIVDIGIPRNLIKNI